VVCDDWRGDPGTRTLVVCPSSAIADDAAAPLVVMQVMQATLSAVYNRRGTTY
jgi:hypothetical protein